MSRSKDPRPRRCDHTCHGAKRRDCECFCGGLFHGKWGAEEKQKFFSEVGVEQGFAALSDEATFLAQSPDGWVGKVLAARAQNPRFRSTPGWVGKDPDPDPDQDPNPDPEDE